MKRDPRAHSGYSFRVKFLAALVLLVPAIGRADDCPPEHAAMGHCTPAPAVARAEPGPELAPPAVTSDCPPEHAAMGHCTTAASASVRVSALVGVVAATYRQPIYEGDYQGVSVGASVAKGRYSAAVNITEYRLARNGISDMGPGDLMLHLHANVFERGAFAAGAMLMTSVPTGDDRRGYGMGHVMLMPEVFATWSPSALSFLAGVGFNQSVGGAAAHAEHGGGAWPLVDPMNASEVTYSGAATYMLAPSIGVGARAMGAVPVGDGVTRLAAAGRALWLGSWISASLEIAGGLVGDPYGLRGTLNTTITLR